jgi:hypothetical protein
MRCESERDLIVKLYKINKFKHPSKKKSNIYFKDIHEGKFISPCHDMQFVYSLEGGEGLIIAMLIILPPKYYFFFVLTLWFLGEGCLVIRSSAAR